MRTRRVTYVIPCYNEADTLEALHHRLSAVARKLDEYDFEWLFVNDASTDDTQLILNSLAAADPRVKVLRLAANRGHQIALTAGLDYATGDVIVTIDADLQDPPELVEQMLDKIREGYDVVHAQRRRRAGEGKFKLITAKLFYAFMRRFSARQLLENVGDFRAFTRPVLKAARGFREPHRFLRGFFVLGGFRQGVVQYDREARCGGTTKYPLRKMIRLAADAVLGFSSVPIKFILYVSAILWLAALVYLSKALYEHFVLQITVPGWTSVVILLAFFSALNLLCLTIIGAYIGRIFEQGQNRPLYWVCDTRNLAAESDQDDSLPLREVQLSKTILSTEQHGSTKEDKGDEEPVEPRRGPSAGVSVS